MLSIEITMNNTSGSAEIKNNNNIELYLFIIVIKLTLLMVYKIVKCGALAYKKHNRKVIEKHAKNLKQFNTSEVQKHESV